MGNNIWSSAASTDYNTAGNWSLGHVPDATETAYFDGTSVIACTLSGAASVIALTTVAAYTGAFSQGGQTITSVGAIAFDHVGTLLLNSTITVTGDAGIHIGTGITTLTLTNCDLDLQGTGSMDIDETMSASIGFRNITCAYAGKTTTFSGDSANGLFMTGVLTLSTGTLSLATSFFIYVSSDSTPVVTAAGHIITATAYSYFAIHQNSSGSVTINVPALNMTGAYIILYFNALITGGTFVINQTGDWLCGYFYVYNNTTTGRATFTYNTQNYNVTCNYDANFLSNGWQNSGKRYTVNCGSSIFTMYSPVNIGTLDDYGFRQDMNFQTSVWNCYSHLYIYIYDSDGADPYSHVTAGTATINFLGAAQSNLNIVHWSAGGEINLPDIVTNKSGLFFISDFKIVTPGVVCDIKSLTIGGSGGYSHTSGRGSLYVIGDFLIDGTGPVTNNSPNIITGNGSFHVGSGVGACDFTGCTVELKGTDTFDIDKTALTFTSVKFNGDGKVQQSTGSAAWTTGRLYVEPGTKVQWKDGVTPIVTTYVVGDCDGSIGKLVEFESLTPGVRFGLNLPATM